MPEDESCQNAISRVTSRVYPLPLDESARLEALNNLDILDTDPEPEFDRITRLARILFGTPIAALSLVDDHRQWFKSISGLHTEETPRDDAFCTYTILKEKPFVVLDAKSDERFATNPLVTGEPSIRFYAGAPLHTKSGAKVGSLCVIDSKVRQNWSSVEDGLLRDLADMVSNQLRAREERKENQKLTEELQALRLQSAQDLLALDKLTGLPDRRALDTIITRAKNAADAADRFFGLVYIDLDKIAMVNDAHGEAAGDEVLKVLSGRFKDALRTGDMVLRIAGDQFLVILQGIEFTSGADRPVRKLLDVASVPVPVAGVGSIGITVSAGVSFYPHSGSTAVELVMEAKKAMLVAKEEGGNICAVNLRGKPISLLSA